MTKFTKKSHCSDCDLTSNLFRFLTVDQLNQINNYRYEVSFLKGEIIFKQGGPLTHIACLTSGLAKVYLESPDKKNLILKVLRPTELVGGPGFRTDNRNHFSVSAMTEVTACFIDLGVFEKMIVENSTFAIEFISYLNRIFIKQYVKVMGLTHKNMHGRIADALLYLSKEVYNGNSFSTSLNRKDIADLSAMTKESAIRIMKEFKDDGIISYNSNQFEILKEDLLMSISEKG